MAPFGGKYLTSYLMAIVMFAISLTVYEKFAKSKKCQNFDLEKKNCSEVENRNFRHSTENVQIHIGGFS